VKITIIITAILFIYAIFSTYYHDTALIGDFGKVIGGTNLSLFGYFAYANLIILFYPLYKLYTDARVRGDIDFYLGWILLFISLILLTALLLEPEQVGLVGTQIVNFLEPLIGKAGLWLFWLMVSALALVFIVDDDFDSSVLNVNMPSVSLPSFAWVGAGFVGLVSILKKIFTNPFSSPKLEDEMMPVLEMEEKPKPIRSKKPRVTRTKPKPTVKSLSEPEAAMAAELNARSQVTQSSMKSSK